MTETNKWIRPWNKENFNDLAYKDDRFFAILIKGLLSWLNTNIILYNKSINHFIFNTGSSYLYIESNGYEFSLNETSGEDGLYMQIPRCIVEMGSISIPLEELTAGFSRGVYERLDGNQYKGFNAQIKRIPVGIDLTLHYVFSTFNEALVVIQEIIDRLAFQRYFNIVYLGQIIECSIELPQDFSIMLNKIDMTNPEMNQKTIDLGIKIYSNYPQIDERSETSNSQYFNSTTSYTHIISGVTVDGNKNSAAKAASNDISINDSSQSQSQSSSVIKSDTLLNGATFENATVSDTETRSITQPSVEEDIEKDKKIRIDHTIQKSERHRFGTRPIENTQAYNIL